MDSFEGRAHEEGGEVTDEFIHSITSGELPPYELKLKLDAIVMLLRNINPALGLRNGTRLVVTRMFDHLIECKGITEISRGNRVYLPKFKNGTKINDVGILLNPDYPIIGASPDGITAKYCIEIKCPSTEKNVETYVVNGNIKQKYMYQLQLQMFFCTEAAWIILCCISRF